jgi:hypothetical protein
MFPDIRHEALRIVRLAGKSSRHCTRFHPGCSLNQWLRQIGSLFLACEIPERRGLRVSILSGVFDTGRPALYDNLLEALLDREEYSSVQLNLMKALDPMLF